MLSVIVPLINWNKIIVQKKGIQHDSSDEENIFRDIEKESQKKKNCTFVGKSEIFVVYNNKNRKQNVLHSKLMLSTKFKTLTNLCQSAGIGVHEWEYFFFKKSIPMKG